MVHITIWKDNTIQLYGMKIHFDQKFEKDLSKSCENVIRKIKALSRLRK